MKRTPIAAAVLAALPLLFAADAHAGPATVDFYMFDGSTPVPGVSLELNDQPQPPTSDTGGTRLSVEPGSYVLVAQTPDGVEIEMPLAVADDETVQISAALYPGRAPIYRVVSSVSGETTVDLGQTDSAELAGTVVDTAGVPVADAEVTINGVTVKTDSTGSYSLRTRPGTYPLLVAAPGYELASVPGVTLAYGDNTAPATTLSAGDASAGVPPSSLAASTLKGVTVEETIQQEEGSEFELAVERRETAQVIDTLSIEQMSRAGDSDAAGALKRVTGLSLVDDKFIYVRGLGERFSSVLLNGAQLPSPDPTRRVVPLDLFPTDILSSIAVQKTYSADMPGEFGGGTLQLRTRGVPDEFLFRLQGTLGYVDGTTGDSTLRATGGGRDWLGYDDGFRDAPDGLFSLPLPPRGSSELTAFGVDLAHKGYEFNKKTAGPDTGFGMSVGNSYGDDDLRFGFLGAARYSQTFDIREEQRAEYSILPDGSLTPQQEYQRDRSERAVDGSLFLSGGLDIGEEHQLTATLMQLRQTTQTDRIDEGVKGGGQLQRDFTSEWIENELLVGQVDGQHAFADLGGLSLAWQYTHSEASRDMPFARTYRYLDQPTLGGFIYDNNNTRVRWEVLEDTVDNGSLKVAYPFQFGTTATLNVAAGLDLVERDRVSDIFRYGVRATDSLPREPLPIDTILSPENFSNGLLFLNAQSRATDFYTADQSLDGVFLQADLDFDQWHLNLGVRQESNEQNVVTQDPFLPDAAPVVGTIDRTDRLPAGTLTWRYSENAQLRLGYSETVSRPDFRELSSAPFNDPILDISVIGNPDLVQTDISNLDLRWEYYFSDLETVSFGLFSKDFDNPIELVRTPSSGELLNLRNADTAESRGFEFEISRSLGYFEEASWLPESWRRSFWQDLVTSLNYTWVDSEVDLGANVGTQTSGQRPMQGQSPYVVNLALSWFDPEGQGEATILYNVFGERISKVGDSGVPDEYEQPFHQLDFTYARVLPWDGWKFKLRLRNLLDPKVEYTQGDAVAREFRKGREIAATLEWKY